LGKSLKAKMGKMKSGKGNRKEIIKVSMMKNGGDK